MNKPASGPQAQEEVVALREALESARSQLYALRTKVQQHEALAQASAHANKLLKERDEALRALGEGVMRAIREGQLTLPPALERLAGGVKKAEERREAHARRIDDLLAEGEAAAQRLRTRKSAPPPQTPLASGPKRR